MSLKDKINSENPLISLDNFRQYHVQMSALQQANTNKIAQIVGELAGATAQLARTTSTVDCDHRYEITGATNDEHNLAVEDQQMLIKKISGRTLVRNQVVKYIITDSVGTVIDSWTSAGLTIVKTQNGYYKVSGTQTNNDAFCYINRPFPLVVGHKYCLMGAPKGGTTATYGIYISQVIAGKYYFDNGDGLIFTNTSDENGDISFFARGAEYKEFTFCPQVIDLTLAYGVGNEPTTVEEVLNDFPEYIPYDEGTFVHSNNKLISIGKNLWKYGDVSGVQRQQITLEKLLRAGTYTISSLVTSSDTDESSCLILFRTKNGDDVSSILLNRNVRSSVVVNIPRDVEVIWFYGSTSNTLSANDTFTFKDIQIEYGETATDYEPYKEEVIEDIGELKQYQYIDNNSDQTINSSILYTVSEEEGYGYNDATIKNSFYIAGISASFKNIGYNFAGKYLFNNNKITKFYVATHPNYQGRLDAVIETAKYYDTAEEFMADIKGSIILGESTESTITESNLPAGMSVHKGGYQIQEGTIPYNIEKQYALSIASQVVQNIEIDREQQKQINNMKVDIDHKQPLLLSGQNIKTFNGQSLLGSGDLTWNDAMFLSKFNDVTAYVNSIDGVIDEYLSGKTYRIYSANDVSSSSYSFDIKFRLNITSGTTKYYTVTLPSKTTRNYVDFRFDNVVLSGETATLYYNVDNVDYTQTLTQEGDSETGDYELYGWGALYLARIYAAVFEPVELVTKADLTEIKPIQSIKEILTVGTRGEINISQMPILTKPIYIYNKTQNNRYYLFVDLASFSVICRKNGVLKDLDEVFYGISMDPGNNTKEIEFLQDEYVDGDIVEVIYEYGYIDPDIFIEL